jgi:hypothetical protein
MALNAAETYIVSLVQHMATHKVGLCLASEAQPEATRLPVRWKDDGDGRARGGREDIWPISDITLTVKVCSKVSLKIDGQGGLWVEAVDTSPPS